MEALAVIGLVSNVISFVQTGNSLRAVIQEYSSAAQAPKEVVALSKRLDLTLKIISDLDDSRKERLDHEELALKTCSEEAEELRKFLEGLRVDTASRSKFKWLSKRGEGMERVWKATKTVNGRAKMEKLQTSLDRILDISMMQQQLKTSGATVRVENNTEILLQKMDMTLRRLDNLHLSSAGTQEKLSERQAKVVFMVPLSRNFGFVGRGDIMANLDSKLSIDGFTDPPQVRRTALCGLGGVGKSQLALEFAYRQKQRFPDCSIFWINAATRARFEESYKQIASELNIHGHTDTKKDVLQLVRNWLEGPYERSWSMIIDNVDDNYIFGRSNSGKPLLDYIPRVSRGCILFTSRNRDIGVDLVGEPISVQLMTEQEAEMLLGDRVRCTSTIDEQHTLFTELDYLPLAIVQAVSYMAKRRKTIAQYLRFFQDDESSKLKLLGHKFAAESGRENESLASVATTWLISFRHIKLESPRAVEILFLASFLERQGIPFHLLISEGESALDFDEAIGVLDSYSFISADESGTNFNIHRLVQLITRSWLREQDCAEFARYASKALQTVSNVFPDVSFETWPTCALYLPHAEAVLTLDSKTEEDLFAQAKLLARISWYFSDQGANLDSARKKAEQSLQIFEDRQNSNSREALRAKGTLAVVLEGLGHSIEAIKILRETMLAQERYLGRDHPDTLDSCASLAVFLGAECKPKFWKESEDLSRRALSGRQAQLPDNHPKILSSITNLGLIMNSQGKHDEAEILLRKATEQQLLLLGESHLDSFISALSLGPVLLQTGRLEEAEKCFRESAARGENILGKENQQVVIVKIGLARCLTDLGRYAEAESLSRTQLNILTKIAGHDPIYEADYIAQLGIILRRQKRYAEAENFLLEELSKRQNLVDSYSPALLQVIDVLSRILYIDLDKEQEASVWARRLMEGNIRLHGEEHADTLSATLWYARILRYLKRLDDAEKFFQRAWEGNLKVLGIRDSATLQSGSLLGRTLQDQENYEKAEDILRQTAEGMEEVLGKNNSEFLDVAYRLAECLAAQRKFKDSEPWYRKVLSGEEETLGVKDEATFTTAVALIGVLYRQNKGYECETLSRRFLIIRLREKGEEEYETLKLRRNLIVSLMIQEKPIWESLFYDHRARLDRIARSHFHKGDFANAAKFFDEGYFISNFVYDFTDKESFDPETVKLRRNQAISMEKDGREDKAEEILRKMLQQAEAALGPLHRESQFLVLYLANFLETRGRSEEAAEMWDKVVGGKKKRLRRSLISNRLGSGADILREPIKCFESCSFIP